MSVVATVPAKLRHRPLAAAVVLSRSASTEGGSSKRPQQWIHKARAARCRAELAYDEWRERAAEWKNCTQSWHTRVSQIRSEDFREAASARVEFGRAKLRQANQGFDEWFNVRCAQGSARLKDSLAGGGGSSSSSSSPIDAVDVPAALLLGIGASGLMQGYTLAGVVLTGAGCFRSARRFVVAKVDKNDINGILCFVPQAVQQMLPPPDLLLHRLKREIESARKDTSFDPKFADPNFYGRDAAMDPRNDYTPERLYSDAMDTIAAHPRVVEVLGSQVVNVEQPDKVVYRIHEGIAEVYLGWRISGQECGAEIQVKATASLLDFIYVFPEEKGRYSMKPEGFVIRPDRPAWSQNLGELPRHMKQPFGKHEGRLFINREGVFDYDYEVRDFRHGREGGSNRWKQGFKGRSSSS